MSHNGPRSSNAIPIPKSEQRLARALRVGRCTSHRKSHEQLLRTCRGSQEGCNTKRQQKQMKPGRLQGHPALLPRGDAIMHRLRPPAQQPGRHLGARGMEQNPVPVLSRLRCPDVAATSQRRDLDIGGGVVRPPQPRQGRRSGGNNRRRQRSRNRDALGCRRDRPPNLRRERLSEKRRQN